LEFLYLRWTDATEPMKTRIESEKSEKQDQLTNLKTLKSSFKVYLNKTLPMIENLSHYWDTSDGETKRRILGCIFKDKFENFDFESCNHIFTPEVESIPLASKFLYKSKNTQGGQKLHLVFNHDPSRIVRFISFRSRTCQAKEGIKACICCASAQGFFISQKLKRAWLLLIKKALHCRARL